MKTPLKIGGISVPKAAHSPSATAMPSERPRNRIVKPKVRPPTPQSSPKKNDQNKVFAGASPSTLSKSRVRMLPRNHGAMIQLQTPPTSQYVSHDQRFTPRYGT